MGQKTFRDCVHGDMIFSEQIVNIIDHPIFQRLRYIGQTGLLYLIYPSMRHSRFEHSLGAAYLAQKKFISQQEFLQTWVESNKERASFNIPNVGKILVEANKTCHSLMDNDYREVFEAAALLHDLGHGPFSHLFEDFGLMEKLNIPDRLIPKCVKIHFSNRSYYDHEDLSVYYAAKLLDDLGWNTARIKMVCYLISKEYRRIVDRDSDSDFPTKFLPLCKMMSIFISGLVDVDRLDYIRRDSLMAGVTFGHMDASKILSDSNALICLSKKEEASYIIKPQTVHAIDHMLVSLYQMYTQVYYHRVNLLVEHEMKLLVNRAVESAKAFHSISIDWHQSITDTSFLDELRLDPNVRNASDFILFRNSEKRRAITSLLKDSDAGESLVKEGFERVSGKAREIAKDASSVLIHEKAVPNTRIPSRFLKWDNESLVMSRLRGYSFVPEFWWCDKEFTEALSKIHKESPSSSQQQRA